MPSKWVGTAVFVFLVEELALARGREMHRILVSVAPIPLSSERIPLFGKETRDE